MAELQITHAERWSPITVVYNTTYYVRLHAMQFLSSEQFVACTVKYTGRRQDESTVHRSV